jgi:IclR family pca regulon transcriptional regulator
MRSQCGREKFMTEKPQASAYFSESLSRGLAVLRAFSRDAPRLRIGEVAERTGLNRAAARRYLLTLRDLGYVAAENDSFVLRPKVLDLGYSYFSSSDIGASIQPLLAELAERSQEATTFAVRDELHVLVVARAAKRLWDLSIGAGTRLPLTQTALGRVLLADMPGRDINTALETLKVPEGERIALLRQLKQAQRQGYAVVQGEFAPKLAAIAVPICDRDNRVLAALNVTSYTAARASLIADVLPMLHETKMQIEAALRSSGTSDLINPRTAESV